ncbi:hypothetical protein [Natronobacterium gregoryi]|uniref:Uncharacterized protein n=2 Tax=Natronobacterium gregoryi TaxID=44930 RepID=L0ADW0_NATGS|nr:hypothetical protein [Natronobacterium gregoryi]AFZ71337.1 hypothetical protein Natgr_0068 [Natronobacterium gregoryi SP2]ELY67039.1 hypothetical protein C490_11491 [Natronobacterium gregoryi SP2]PLK18456.1 hypothetical protein CYV19_17805 [Natronobacterium gregoryi SP2]SFJ70567.1 hypothetical protein SAMN05443661_16113 [Natronobacterium gregoryi]
MTDSKLYERPDKPLVCAADRLLGTSGLARRCQFVVASTAPIVGTADWLETVAGSPREEEADDSVAV